MVTQMSAKISGRRYRRWGHDEISELLENGLLGFVPSEQDTLLTYLGSHGRALPEEVSRLRKATQGSCFKVWMRIDRPLMSSFTWHECMRMRYGRADSSIKSLLPADWIKHLDLTILQLKRRPTLSDAQLLEMLEVALGRFDSGMGYAALAITYIRAGVRGSKALNQFLKSPIWSTGVSELARDMSIPSHFGAMEEYYSEHFLTYPAAAVGSSAEARGAMIYWLMYLTNWIGVDPDSELPVELRALRKPVLRVDPIRDRQDFRIIEEAYTKILGLPESYFKGIVQAMYDMRIQVVDQERESFGNAVYSASKVLSKLRPATWQGYVDWIEAFREAFKRQTKPRRTVSSQDERRSIIARLMRAMMDTDPLLRIVFHDTVFSGRDYLDVQRDRPGPVADKVQRWVSYSAVTEFRKVIRGRGPETVCRILGKLPGLSSPIKRLIVRHDGRGTFEYVAPLISALFLSNPVVTPDAVQAGYRKVLKHLKSHKRT